MKKLLIVCGPTATGKTALAIKLAKIFNGELVSVDSRQVYKFMDIGTGKDVSDFNFKLSDLKWKRKKIGYYFKDKLKIWGLDLVKPDEEFSVAHWLDFAHLIIQDIWQRKKLAIVVGGTGFWLKALINKIDSLGIAPDWQLRKQLEKKGVEQLREMLAGLDPGRLQRMNYSDKNNPRRLIRAIEIARKRKDLRFKPQVLRFKIDRLLMIGLKASNKVLYQGIDQRVEKRIKQGAEKEVRALIKKGYSWNLFSLTATGYKEWRPFLEAKSTLKEVITRWKFNEHQLARRQLTWFKKNQKINWFDIEKPSWQKNVVKLVKSWYYKNNGKN